MPRITTIRAAWEQQVRSSIGSEVNVSGWFVDGVKLPRVMLVEEPGLSVDILSDFGSQYAGLRYRVVVEVGGTDALSAAQMLDRLVSWDDALSVWQAMSNDRSFGLGESVVKSITLGDEWDVQPDLGRAELPVSMTVVKS